MIPDAPVVHGAGAAHRFGPAVRVLDTLAGLLSAGLLVLGVLLLLTQLIAPLSAAGWGQAAGPGWPSVLAHLSVGVVGELVVRLRGRLPRALRVTADGAVVFSAGFVVAWAWWP